MELKVLPLRYSSWSMRPWLALTAAGIPFKSTTVELPSMKRQEAKDGKQIKVDLDAEELQRRRDLGSVRGLFPVLHIENDVRIYESLAICEYANDLKPAAGLWPKDIVARNLARAACLEMATGFANVRDELSCNVFARLDLNGKLRDNTKTEIKRILELFNDCFRARDRLGLKGPFLFGQFGIVDCFYFPVLTRFATYNIAMPKEVQVYKEAVYNHEAVKKLFALMPNEPAITIYDDGIVAKGGKVGILTNYDTKIQF